MHFRLPFILEAETRASVAVAGVLRINLRNILLQYQTNLSRIEREQAT